MSKKNLEKKPASKKGRRVYDNSARAEKSVQTQKKIIETLVTLLVEKRGGEVPMQELARRSEITQRSIFRFFKDKKTLHEAMDKYLMSYLQASNEQMQTLDFVGFGKNTYQLFDRHEALTTAYIFSPFGQEARVLLRKKLVQAMIAKIVHERKLDLSPQKLKRLALITSLINAKIWFDIKTDFGFSGEDMGEAVEWSLNTLLTNL